jgi:exopolysaccharide/PEP-CTERM locus tyrosine autokinase
MERIKQALELARQERMKNSGKGASSTGANIVTNGGSLSGVRNRSVAETNIEYSETRDISISVAELRQKRILIDQKNAVADSYKILRTQILQRMQEKGWNTLAVTSASDGDGKTLTAINLAISLAREVDHTVLLVDANLRQPSIQHQMGFHAEYGLSDYIQKDISLNKILIHPEGIPRFVILPAGHAMDHSSEMLSSPKMSRLVSELKNRYPSRIVIFDLPALLTASDALAFSPHIDAMLIVVGEGCTKSDDLHRAFEMLQGVEVIGTVLNKAYTRDRDYGDMELKEGRISRFINRLSKKTLPDWLRS